jgi:hypothetical protein
MVDLECLVVMEGLKAQMDVSQGKMEATNKTG